MLISRLVVVSVVWARSIAGFTAVVYGDVSIPRGSRRHRRVLVAAQEDSSGEAVAWSSSEATSSTTAGEAPIVEIASEPVPDEALTTVEAAEAPSEPAEDEVQPIAAQLAAEDEDTAASEGSEESSAPTADADAIVAALQGSAIEFVEMEAEMDDRVGEVASHELVRSMSPGRL